MKNIFMLVSLILITPISYAGLFSSDHKIVRDKDCTLKLGKYNHEVVCANHKKKSRLSFCQGDIVSFEGGADAIQVFVIKNHMAYGRGVRFKKTVRYHTDKVQRVKQLSCNNKKTYIKENEVSVIRAYHNKNYTDR